MGGIGDCIAASGIISYLKSVNGEIQVYGGALSDLLHMENVKVIDARPRLYKQLHTDYTLSIEPNTGYTHFKQHLSYHFADQVGIARCIRRPNLTTCLSTSLVLNAYSLPYKQYIVVTRLAGWAPRVPGKEDMDWAIGYLKQKTGLPVVEVGANGDVSQTSSHTDVNLLSKTSVRSLYHILDGAKYIFTLDSMVYHLAMERHLRTPALVWWGNIRPELRAYPGSFDYHSGLCFECGDKDLMTVPRYCFNGTNACLTLVKDKDGCCDRGHDFPLSSLSESGECQVFCRRYRLGVLQRARDRRWSWKVRLPGCHTHRQRHSHQCKQFKEIRGQIA